MITFLWIVAGIVVNAVIGASVLVCVDNDDHQLYKWYCACPDPTGILQFLVVQFWPLTAGLFWYRLR